MSHNANARSSDSAAVTHRRPTPSIYPTTAGTIRPGRLPSVTTGAVTTSIFSNDGGAGANELTI
jgi:hypothetical protein